MPNWNVPLSDLDYGPEEELAALRVLKSKWLSMGPEVQAFEEEFASLIGLQHAIAVANGTAALHLAYLALGLGPGDEVIQPAINFVAAANMTMAVGATPVFADIVGLHEPVIDAVEVERKITPRTKAVVVMHYGGYFGDMTSLRKICDRHGLALVEDACHAVGARYANSGAITPHGKMAGAIGDIGCFSFFSNKNLPVGEGGMLVTGRDDLAGRLRRLRSHGMTSLTWDRHKGHARSYDVVLNGYNYRFDELRAALGRTQLSKLEKNNKARRDLVTLYRRELAIDAQWLVPFDKHIGNSSGHLMSVVAPSDSLRNQAVEMLTARGIQTSMHYPCITGFAAFEGCSSDGLDRSIAFANRSITLPLFPGLPTSAVTDICTALRSTRPLAPQQS